MSASLAIAVVSATGCDQSPTSPTTPSLEAVDFNQIDAGKVLFQRRDFEESWVDSYYLIDADARSASRVFADRNLESPVISPDGRSVAFQADTQVSGLVWRRPVYMSDLPGGEARRLSPLTDAYDTGPAWAHDGTVVYVQFFPGGFTYARILSSPQTGAAPVELRGFQLEDGQSTICPLPDSNPVLSMSVRGGLAYTCLGGLAVAALEGDPFVTYELGAVEGLAWSADGRQIAMTVLQRTGGLISGTVVQVLDIDTGAVRTLAAISRNDNNVWMVGLRHSSVCWLPGDRRVVFAAPHVFFGDTSLRANVYIVGADGSGLARLTTQPNAFDSNVSCTR